MSLIRTEYAVSRRSGLLGMLFSALFALPLFYPAVATAQELKQIKLTEKHMQGFIAVSEDLGQLYDGANPDKPDPKLEPEAEALVKKNGFASLAEYESFPASTRRRRKFTEPPDQIKREIASIKANKSIPEPQKKEDLAQLEAALKDAKPIQFKENIALVLKYLDKLPPLMQEQGPAD